MNSIEVTIKEFNTAISRKIVPASQRSLHSIGKPLPVIMRPVLMQAVENGVSEVKSILPGVTKINDSVKNPLDETESDEVDETLMSIGTQPVLQKGHNRSLRYAGIFKPRVLICGHSDAGQSYVASAILQELEQLHQFKLDSTRTSDDLTAWFAEALNRLPRASVLYVPMIESLNDILFDLLNTLLAGLEPTMPMLLLATASSSIENLEPDVVDMFAAHKFTARIHELKLPSPEQRSQFFQPLIQKYVHKPLESKTPPVIEKLAEIPIAETRKLSEKELSRLRRKEQVSLRQLRNFLRDMLGKIIRDRRFSLFLRPVDLEEVEDYLQVIDQPMDLETMMLKIDSCQYESAQQFLQDIDLITDNALEYNPNRDSNDKLIRHRACALRDYANAIIDAEMESDFEEMCQEMQRTRQERGESVSKDAPRLLRPLPTPQIAVDKQKENEDTEIESLHSPDVNMTNGALQPVVNGLANGLEHHKVPNGRKNRKKKKGRQSSIAPITSQSSEVKSNTDFPATKSDVITVPSPEPESMEMTAQNPVTQQREPESVDIVIDKEIMDNVLQEIVIATSGCGLDLMENLYWTLFRTITKRIKDQDRSLLPTELRSDINRFKDILEQKEREKELLKPVEDCESSNTDS